MKWMKEALRKQIEDEMLEILWDSGIDPYARANWSGESVLDNATDRIVNKIFED